jgi:hypothetical protein
MIDQPVSESNYQARDMISGLASGASITFSKSISTAGLSIGTHTLYIKEDYWYNLVAESNESNNVRSVTFNVVGSGSAHNENAADLSGDVHSHAAACCCQYCSSAVDHADHEPHGLPSWIGATEHTSYKDWVYDRFHGRDWVAGSWGDWLMG